MLQLSKYPLIVLGAGAAVGYFIYKHRDELLERARFAAEQTSEIMRGPREHLEGLDSAGKPPSTGAAES